MSGIMLADEPSNVVNIKVVGVGGGGGNAVNRMIDHGITSVDFVAINTDQAVLAKSRAVHKIRIGKTGYGAGGNPEVGKKAAEENRDEIAAAFKGTQMVFITACMGGGTGTGASPIVASIAREMGILTIGIVTKPFLFEGKRRMEQAEEGIAELREHVDSLVVIPNERLKLVSEQKITLFNAFAIADDVLRQGVQSISDLINIEGYINLDFMDVTAIMRDAGYAHMGFSTAEGKDRAELASSAAISSPLLETSIDGAKGVIVNLTVPISFDMDEANIAMEKIQEAMHPDATVIWGVAFDEALEEKMKITVVATGFDTEFKPKIAPASLNTIFSGSSLETETEEQKNSFDADSDVDVELDDILKIFKDKVN
ncbi:MAG: cell division protein FtsZ [Oscillospiraceae bacterium]|nr:cell division protein FtsZ [Oscillospiraceae bacterium]